MDRNRVIGRGGSIPWHLPADLKWFRVKTRGHAVIMGRKTHQSIGRALPGRRNVVITRQEQYDAPDCIVVGSLAEAIDLARDEEVASAREDAEIFVIGGGEVYAEALPLADLLYLTYVDTTVPDGDAFFPEIDDEAWREVAREHRPADDQNAFPMTFVTYDRR